MAHSPYRGTLSLSAPEVIELVRREGVSACIKGIAERIEADYRRWNEFDKSPRVGSDSGAGVVELMPIADAARFSFKCVNGHPGNSRYGLPTVMAFGVLADMANGVPLLLSDLTLVTAIRTAAMSALAARVLARPGSRAMALIGNGAQSEFQALAFRDLVGIRELRLFDIDRAATAKLVANLAGQGMHVVIATSAADAARRADIITTATADKACATIVTPDMVRPGMHLNAIGGDCAGKTELARTVVEAAEIFVEFEPQTRVEGEIQQLPADAPVTEFWRVLAGEAPGRTSDAQVTLFDSVGFALEDYSALSFLYDAAQEMGLGTMIELVAQNEDPKNLFGLLHGDPLPILERRRMPHASVGLLLH